VTGAQVISAKWRRELQPSRRLTAREKAPPLGRSQFPCALLPGQPSGSRRWHPCCRRCLLKGCECWFLPPDLPRSCGVLARLACRSTLQGHSPRQGTTPRAGQTPSRACAAAILSCRAAAPNISHRAGLPGDRGRDNPQVRFDADYPRSQPERRPAPSRNSFKFLRPAVQ
jgi:hypothetical protein